MIMQMNSNYKKPLLQLISIRVICNCDWITGSKVGAQPLIAETRVAKGTPRPVLANPGYHGHTCMLVEHAHMHAHTSYSRCLALMRAYGR